MSDWELVEEVREQPTENQPSLLNKIGKGYLNYAGGALRGLGQSAGDFGASAINWPISGIEHLTGAKLPHVPHPHLINENPNSLGESLGQILGQFSGSLALPGGTAVKSAQLANKGYQAINAGKKLPLIGKLLAGGAGGALEGAAGNEENRPLGASIGSLLGGGAQAANSTYNLMKGVKSSNIAKQIKKEMESLTEDFTKRFESHIAAGEEAGANKFLKAEKGAKIPLLKKAGEGKLVYGLEKFNENPTLANAHRAQSDLNKVVTKYSKSREGTLESDVHAEALKLKNRLLKRISEAFEKSGTHEHGAGYQQSRVDYAKNLAPYLESPTIKGYLGKNSGGIQKVRPSQFADKLLKEEEFLAQAGHKHPELLHRERIKTMVNHPATKLAAVGAMAYLPYEIRKLLGH